MVELIVCTTCRGPGRVSGVGAAFATAVAAAAAGTGVAVTRAECLWSCDRGASAQLRGQGRAGYVMGGFVAADAGALVDFARAYAASGDGVVPYPAWPAAVLGKFIARTPPAGGALDRVS